MLACSDEANAGWMHLGSGNLNRKTFWVMPVEPSPGYPLQQVLRHISGSRSRSIWDMMADLRADINWDLELYTLDISDRLVPGEFTAGLFRVRAFEPPSRHPLWRIAESEPARVLPLPGPPALRDRRHRPEPAGEEDEEDREDEDDHLSDQNDDSDDRPGAGPRARDAMRRVLYRHAVRAWDVPGSETSSDGAAADDDDGDVGGPAPAVPVPPAPPPLAVPLPVVPVGAPAGGVRGPMRGRGGRGRGRGGERPVRGIPWGPFVISEIVSDGVRIGWGATCKRHRDHADSAKTICKKHLPYGRLDPLDDASCRLRLKRWLLKGADIDPGDAYGRTFHLGENPRLLETPETEEACDAQLLVSFPP